MLATILLVVATLLISGVIVLIVAARRAPVGFEDEAGFHVVEQHPRAAPVSAPGPVVRATIHSR